VDHLRPLDDAFVVLERDNLPMHIGSLLVFDGEPPGFHELLAWIAGRLDRLPRYRQVIAPVPLHLGPPAWLDDQHFDLRFHVRNTALPAPGTDEQLRTLTSRLLSMRLDMRRPPWELWLVEGLQHGRFAVVNKVHHAMVDGISGSDIMELLLDDRPDSAAPQSSSWRPAPWPAPAARLVSSVAAGVAAPADRLRHLGAVLRHPAGAVARAGAAVVGTVRLGEQLAHTEDHLLGTPGTHRRWAWAEGDLGEVKRIKNTLGGTVNDVILSAIAGGYRRFLLHRGAALVEADVVRTMVPVSTRPAAGPKGGNEVAALFVDLPVGAPDAIGRFERMRESMAAVKSSGMLQGTDALVENAVFVPPALFAAAGKLAARAPQPAVATITTNVPGPQRELFLLGRPLVRFLPYVPLGMNQLITVAIISYHGQLCCGVTADYEQVPDVQVLAEGIEEALADLSAAARSTPG
jgi:WS/DGAT/MGAT family acyltransferase